MKKLVIIFLLLAIFCSVFAGCGMQGEDNGDEFHIVCTVFPQYDWLRNITKGCENIKLTLLLQSGSDMHSYQPTVKDLSLIGSCDALVYVGGESDAWVKEYISTSGKKDTLYLSLLDELGDRALDLPRAFEQEHGDHQHSHECIKDEHIWLSLKNAARLCGALCDKLSSLVPENAQTLKSNTEEYLSMLNELDKDYTDSVKQSECKTLLFADRFPFVYLANDYGIEYYSAFNSCSAETEATFETVAYLADIINSKGLKTVMILEGSDSALADTVISTSSSACTVRALDSLQSVTSEQIRGGLTYLETMKSNLDVIKEALK